MGRYDQEFVTMFAGLEKQLQDIDDNPRHRAILKNYRRHGLLEVAGRYKELLAPDMTVEHPRSASTRAGSRSSSTAWSRWSASTSR